MRPAYAFLLVCFSIWAPSAHSQQSPPKLKTFPSFHGFWNIPLGTDFTSALSSAKSRNEGVRVDGDKILLDEVEFASRKGHMILMFCDDEFYQGVFSEEREKFLDVLSSYRLLITEIQDKYGKPETVRDEIPNYVRAGKTQLLQDEWLEYAINKGEAQLTSVWMFLDSKGQEITIMTTIRDTQRLTVVCFETERLRKKRKQNSVSSTDY